MLLNSIPNGKLSALCVRYFKHEQTFKLSYRVRTRISYSLKDALNRDQTYESMHGDIINQSTASVIFVEDIVKPNCTYRSPFSESATLLLYAQNTSTTGSTFGSMCSKLMS